MSLKILLFLENSEDPDEMQYVAAFHLGLHCFPQYFLGDSSKQRVNVHLLDFEAIMHLL